MIQRGESDLINSNACPTKFDADAVHGASAARWHTMQFIRVLLFMIVAGAAG